MNSSQNSVLLVRKIDSRAEMPARAHPGDAGLDLRTLDPVELLPQQSALVSTGLSFAIPEGCVGLVLDRSSMAKKGVKTAGGVIDSGYRGELKVMLWNIGATPQTLEAGDRIAQLVIFPIAFPVPTEIHSQVSDEEWVSTTARGEGGFGSSGR